MELYFVKTKYMRAKALKEKYPDIWERTYNSMVLELKECMPRADVALFEDGYKHSKIDRLAHNAAFICCSEIHKLLKN